MKEVLFIYSLVDVYYSDVGLSRFKEVVHLQFKALKVHPEKIIKYVKNKVLKFRSVEICNYQHLKSYLTFGYQVLRLHKVLTLQIGSKMIKVVVLC